MSTEMRMLKNLDLGLNIRVILQRGKPYFIGNEVGSTLGFKDPKGFIRDNVDPEDKMTLKELLEGGGGALPSFVFP